MFATFKASVQQAFFHSLEQAGCLSLKTEGPESSDEEDNDDEYDDAQVHGNVLTPTRVVGFGSFLRNVPKTDKFVVEKFHHVEFACHDVSNTFRRFSWALGMPVIAKSDLSTGNSVYCSHVLKSNDLVFVFSAPYSTNVKQESVAIPLPYYNPARERSFLLAHGLSVRALAVQVGDVEEAYAVSTSNGAVGVTSPTILVDHKSGGRVEVAEVVLLGDVLLRFVRNLDFKGEFLPNYEAASNQVMSYGIRRLDHAVGMVPDLDEAVDHIMAFTGFHEFVETEEEDDDEDRDLNRVVLANNFETVLLPLVEPGDDEEQEQFVGDFLESNEGAGFQHLALMCTDIIHTVQEMQARSQIGGFEFCHKPSGKYYKEVATRVGKLLSQKQLKQIEELGILVGTDERGILLQIFTKPVGDRSAFFLEIIQRVGGIEKGPDGRDFQRGGCGGFGRCNLMELFHSPEKFRRMSKHDVDDDSKPCLC